MKERGIGRRAFSKFVLGTIGIVWCEVLAISAKRLYPFSGLINLENSGEVKPEELQIKSLGETKTEGGIVKLNEEEFAKGILLAAKMQDPVFGQSKVRELLERRPFEVTIEQQIPRQFYYEGEAYTPVAFYTPYLARGPRITFNKTFIDEYYQALKNVDLARQVSIDAVVYHEISHFLQDIEHPIEHLVTTAVRSVREMANVFSFIGQYPVWEESLEVDAQKKAERITGDLLNEFLRHPEIDLWPFGHFFTFG